MRVTVYCRLTLAVAAIALAAGCSGGSALPATPAAQPYAKALSSYDPFAPAIEIAPLAEALDSAQYKAAGAFTVTALTPLNTADNEALAALELRSVGDSLEVSLTAPLPGLALYMSYDAASQHVSSMEAGSPGAIGYALEYEPGRLAAGVAGIRGAQLPTGQVLVRVTLADGALTGAIRRPSITQDKRSAVRDLEAVDNNDGSATLGWSERNTGDYDLNGEVNISDITPVGKNFNKVYGTESPDYAQLEVVDGDDNFEVNISDLTPIGLNFGSIITGYNVYRTELSSEDEEPDPADSGRWTKVENESDPGGPSAPRDFNGQDFRLRYSFVDDSGNGNFGWYVAPVGIATDDPLEGPVSNVVTLPVGGGAPPLAALTFEIMPPDGELMNVDNEFYVAVKVEGVEGLFSANVRFEYDAGLVEFLEGVAAYESNANFLTPPLFLAVDDVGPAGSPYVLLGFNATQTQGEPGKTGDGALG
ncbi:MAG TPA: hypothetical protein ENO21_04730, partial [Firmicutes bacterium]|nr:hypothetical protein [Bacillota bacterium]